MSALPVARVRAPWWRRLAAWLRWLDGERATGLAMLPPGCDLRWLYGTRICRFEFEVRNETPYAGARRRQAAAHLDARSRRPEARMTTVRQQQPTPRTCGQTVLAMIAAQGRARRSVGGK